MRRLSFLLVFVILQAPLVSAETIQLKSEKIVDGTIIEKSDTYIKVDMGVGVDITYFLDSVDNIDGVPIVVPELESAEPLSVRKKETPKEDIGLKPDTFVSWPAPKKKSTVYKSDKFGVSIHGPHDWNMIVIEKTPYDNMLEKAEQTYNLLANGSDSAQIARSFMQKEFGLGKDFTKEEMVDKIMAGSFDMMGIPEEKRQGMIEAGRQSTELVKFLNYMSPESIEYGAAGLQLPVQERVGIALSITDVSRKINMRTVWDFVNNAIKQTEQAKIIQEATIFQKPHEININGNKMVRYGTTISMQMPQGASSGAKSQTASINVFCLKGRKLYGLSYFGLSQMSFQQNLPKFEAALASFTIK